MGKKILMMEMDRFHGNECPFTPACIDRGNFKAVAGYWKKCGQAIGR